MGAAARKQMSPRPSRKRLLAAFVDELATLGYEPFVDGDRTLRLRNCPYYDIARENTNFVCSMNLALMQGVSEGLDLSEVSPVLEPKDGICCVAFHTKSKADKPAGADTKTGAGSPFC